MVEVEERWRRRCLAAQRRRRVGLQLAVLAQERRARHLRQRGVVGRRLAHLQPAVAEAELGAAGDGVAPLPDPVGVHEVQRACSDTPR